MASASPSRSLASSSTVTLKDLIKVSDHVYAYHPPKCDVSLRDAELTGEAATNVNSTELAIDSKPGPGVILIFGWMDAQIPHLNKYIDEYRLIYPTATIFLLRNWMNMFWMSRDSKEKILLPVIDLLEQAEKLSRAEGRGPSKMLIHVFSNGGCFQLYDLQRLLASRGKKSETSELPREMLLVMDSCPGMGGYRKSLAALTASIRSDLIKYLTMAVLSVLYLIWRLTILFGLFGARDIFEDMRRDMLKPNIISSSSTSTEPTSRLYFYSQNDDMVSYMEVEGHIAEVRRRGWDVVYYDFGKSRHVAHARTDPGRYWSLVKECWMKSVDRK